MKVRSLLYMVFLVLVPSMGHAQTEIDERALIEVKDGISIRQDSLFLLNLRFRMQNRLGVTSVGGDDLRIATTDFRDSPKGLFSSPPQCYMHHQASFIPSIFPEGTKLGVDADFFYMPAYKSKEAELGKPVLGAGTLAMITKDSPAARAFIDFLKTPIAHEVWMAQSGFLTPLKSVNPDAYANDALKKQGNILLNSTTFRFDGSDLMPGAVGAGTFWTGMVDYVGGKSAKDVADAVQASWPAK